jgi:TPR repeat protein
MKSNEFIKILAASLICLLLTSYGQEESFALKQKAEQGDADAQSFLGCCHSKGLGVPQE